MENLTAVDGGAALIIIVSAILAFSRGLVREMMAILGWVGAAIAAYYFAPGVQPLVKELPVVGEFLSEYLGPLLLRARPLAAETETAEVRV